MQIECPAVRKIACKCNAHFCLNVVSLYFSVSNQYSSQRIVILSVCLNSLEVVSEEYLVFIINLNLLSLFELQSAVIADKISFPHYASLQQNGSRVKGDGIKSFAELKFFKTYA